MGELEEEKATKQMTWMRDGMGLAGIFYEPFVPTSPSRHSENTPKSNHSHIAWGALFLSLPHPTLGRG